VPRTVARWGAFEDAVANCANSGNDLLSVNVTKQPRLSIKRAAHSAYLSLLLTMTEPLTFSGRPPGHDVLSA